MSGSAARTIAIRLSTQDAELVRRQLEKLGADGKRALEQIDTASAKAQPAMRGLATASDGAARGFQALGVSMGGTSSGFITAAGRAGNVAAALAAIGVGAAAAGAAIARAGDQATESLARLQAATNSVGAAERVYQGLFALSQQTGVAIADSANAFSRFAVAARQIGATNDEVLSLVRTVQQAGIVAGASTAETSSTVMQLGQALASGRLQGDELRSILENMPTLAEALARELGASVGELRKLGEEGKLTADVVMPALIRAGQNINAEFEKMPVTMGRSFAILGESMARFAADLDRALGLSQSIARAAQAAAAAVNQGRVAVGLGTPIEQATAGYERNRDRLDVLDRQIQNAETALSETALPGGTRGIMRRNLDALRRDRELAIRDLQQFIEQRNRLEREAQEAGDAESFTATQRQIASQREAAQQRLSDLQDSLERDRKVRAEHAERVREIDDQARRGAIDPAEAARLRALADKARDDALSKLEETQARANETDREAQRLIERGISLAQQSASEQEKFADQVRALEAAQAAGRITQEQYNRAIGELDPEARRARDAMEKARQEAERFAERSKDALASIGENAMDRIGSGIVTAFAIGEKAVINWGSIARQVIASVVTDIAKLAIVNPLANSIFGASRPTLTAAFQGGGQGVAPTGVTSSAPSVGIGEVFGIANAFGGGGGGMFSGLGSSLGLSGAGGLLSTPLWTTSAGAMATAPLPAGVMGPVLPVTALGPAGMGATLGSLVGGAGAGFGAGMLASSLIGAQRGTVGPGGMIGAGGGAVAGAIIGSVIPGIGTLAGGLIGGAIGGGAGAMFGPTKKGMASRAGGDVFLGTDENGRLIITDARGKRFDEGAARAEVQSQLDAINAQVGARGLSFAGAGQTAVGFGQASGSPRELSMTALVGQLRGGNANQMTAFGTLAGRGGNLEQALQAADFVTQIFEPLTKAAKQTDAFTAAMEALAKTYDDAITKARDLGLATETLDVKRSEALAKLRADAQRNFDSALRGARGEGFVDQLMAIREGWQANASAYLAAGRDPNTLYAAQVSAIVNNLDVKQLTTAIEALRGVDDVAVLFAETARTQKQVAESLAKTADALQSALNAGGAIRGYLDSLGATSAGGLSPSDQFKNAQGIFSRDLALSRGGDLDALGRITGSADNLLTAGRGMFASGPEFQALLQMVQSTLANLPATRSYEQQTLDTLTRIATGQQTAVQLLGVLSADVNADQRITWPEFEAWTAVNGAQTTQLVEALGVSNLALSAIFAQLGADANSDQRITWPEFDEWASANAREVGQLAVQLGVSNASLSEIFRKLDTNGDGTITRLETQNSTLAAIFAQLDTNGDGTLTQLEIQSGLATAANNRLDGVLATGTGTVEQLVQQNSLSAALVALGQLTYSGNIIMYESLAAANQNLMLGNRYAAATAYNTMLLAERSGGGGIAITGYAKGGVFDGPIMFPMRDGMGMMGEAGPEAIMPLARGSDGSLGVRVNGSGSDGMARLIDSLIKEVTELRAEMARMVSAGERTADAAEDTAATNATMARREVVVGRRVA